MSSDRVKSHQKLNHNLFNFQTNLFRNARSLFSGNYGPKTIISQWYRTHIKVVGRKRNNKYHNHIYININVFAFLS